MTKEEDQIDIYCQGGCGSITGANQYCCSTYCPNQSPDICSETQQQYYLFQSQELNNINDNKVELTPSDEEVKPKKRKKLILSKNKAFLF